MHSVLNVQVSFHVSIFLSSWCMTWRPFVKWSFSLDLLFLMKYISPLRSGGMHCTQCTVYSGSVLVHITVYRAVQAQRTCGCIIVKGTNCYPRTFCWPIWTSYRTSLRAFVTFLWFVQKGPTIRSFMHCWRCYTNTLLMALLTPNIKLCEVWSSFSWILYLLRIVEVLT
jgi:hypothetical protein